MEENTHMLASKKTRRGVIGAVVLAGAMVLGGFAYTQAATVATSVAGNGVGTVTAINVTAVSYTLDATDKAEADSFTLTLSAAPTAAQRVWAQPDASAAWVDCGLGDGVSTTATCTGPFVVADIDQMEVTIVQV